jgi:hypothetical protein
MYTINKSTFLEKYSKATLVKTYKNGSEDYECKMPCPRCSGEGIVFTHVLNGRKMPAIPDNGVCYACEGRRYVLGTIHVVPDEVMAKKEAQKANARERVLEKRKEQHIREGYKPIDFKIADWYHDCNLSFGWKYYLIAKETEKACLIRFLIDLEHVEYSMWIPKKAIIRG